MKRSEIMGTKIILWEGARVLVVKRLFRCFRSSINQSDFPGLFRARRYRHVLLRPGATRPITGLVNHAPDFFELGPATVPKNGSGIRLRGFGAALGTITGLFHFIMAPEGVLCTKPNPIC